MVAWSQLFKEIIPACVIPNAGGFLATSMVHPRRDEWYRRLNKPSWTPSEWIFPPVWTFLYTSMGYASWLVWQQTGGFTKAAQLPLALYGTNLLLNWAWPPIFFGYGKLGLGAAEITLLLASTVATTYSFFGISEKAGWLMTPYCAWLCLATALTWSIYINNDQATADRDPDAPKGGFPFAMRD